MNTNEIVVLFKFYIINLAQITYIWYVLYITKHFYLFENFIHIYYIVWSYPSLHSTPAESPSVLISSNFMSFSSCLKPAEPNSIIAAFIAWVCSHPLEHWQTLFWLNHFHHIFSAIFLSPPYCTNLSDPFSRSYLECSITSSS